MPYTAFRKTNGGVKVSKAGGGGFVAHTRSLAQAHRTAALRELASRGKLRVAKKNPGSSTLRGG